MLQAGRVAPGLILFCDRAVDVAVAEVQRIQEPEESGEVEEISEQETQLVRPEGRNRVLAQELELQV